MLTLISIILLVANLFMIGVNVEKGNTLSAALSGAASLVALCTTVLSLSI